MCIGLELGLVVFGIFALVKGRFSVSRSKVVAGTAARVMGVLALLPIPLAIVVHTLYAAASIRSGTEMDRAAAQDVDGAITIGVVVLLLVVGIALGKPKQPPQLPQAFPVEDPPQFPGQPQD